MNANPAECERLAFMTVRLHNDEVRIDEDLVQQLLRTQLPELANQDLHLVPAQGTDNVMFRLVSRRRLGVCSSSANGCPGWRRGCRWRCRYQWQAASPPAPIHSLGWCAPG